MNALLSELGDLSLFVHMMLTNIPQDPHTFAMVSEIMTLVAFDPIPVDDQLDKLFSEKKGFSPSFE